MDDLVSQERERCAAVVESYANKLKTAYQLARGKLSPKADSHARGKIEAAIFIAELIRSEKTA